LHASGKRYKRPKVPTSGVKGLGSLSVVRAQSSFTAAAYLVSVVMDTAGSGLAQHAGFGKGRLKISRGPTACPLQFASTGVKEQSSALFLVPSADQAH